MKKEVLGSLILISGEYDAWPFSIFLKNVNMMHDFEKKGNNLLPFEVFKIKESKNKERLSPCLFWRLAI